MLDDGKCASKRIQCGEAELRWWQGSALAIVLGNVTETAALNLRENGVLPKRSGQVFMEGLGVQNYRRSIQHNPKLL